MTQNEVEVVNEIENGLCSEFSWLFRDSNKYIAMIKIVENAVDKYSKEIRKQVCDEIREKAEAFGSGVNGQLGYIVTLLLLDQIEKGEE